MQVTEMNFKQADLGVRSSPVLVQNSGFFLA